MGKAILTVMAAGLVGVMGRGVLATDLNIQMTVDNSFTYSLSTDDTVQGTSLGTGNDWQTTYPFSTTLSSGVPLFLHIQATDLGPPAMFIGQFDLSDTGYHFADGSQQLLTGSPLWQVSKTGFGLNDAATADEGLQGSAPWGTRPSIDSSARFIWADENVSAVYFSAEILPAGVPEPGAVGLLALGTVGMFMRRRRI